MTTFTPSCVIPSCTAAKRSEVPDIGYHVVPPPPDPSFVGLSVATSGSRRGMGLGYGYKRQRLRAVWISILRILRKDPKWTPKLFFDHICSRHFKTDELVLTEKESSFSRGWMQQRLAPMAVPSLNLQSDDDENATTRNRVTRHMIPTVNLLKDDPIVESALSKYLIDNPRGYDCALCHQRVQTVTEVKVERVETFTTFMSWRTSMEWVGPPPVLLQPLPQTKKRGRPRKQCSCHCCSSCASYVNQVWDLKLRLDKILEQAKVTLASYLRPVVPASVGPESRTTEKQTFKDSYTQTDNDAFTSDLSDGNDRKKPRTNLPLQIPTVRAIKEEADELGDDLYFDDGTHPNEDDNDCFDEFDNGNSDTHDMALSVSVVAINSERTEKGTPKSIENSVFDGKATKQEPPAVKSEKESLDKMKKQTPAPAKQLPLTVTGMVLSQADKERLCKTSKAFSNMLNGKLGGKSIILVRPVSPAQPGKLSMVNPQRITDLKFKSSTIPLKKFNKKLKMQPMLNKGDGGDKPNPNPNAPKPQGATLGKVKRMRTLAKQIITEKRRNKILPSSSVTGNTAAEESGIGTGGDNNVLSSPKRKKKLWKPKPKSSGYRKPDPRLTVPTVNLSTQQKEELRQTSNLFCHSVGRNLPFRCFIDGCLKSYKNYQLLLYHQRHYHFNQKPFECAVCVKKYATFNDLRSHNILKHLDSNLSAKFKCAAEGCNEEFSKLLDLTIHSKRAHKQQCHQLPPVPCPVCGFTSTKRIYILHHIKKSHPFHKLIHCSKCAKRLFTNEEFETHECVPDKFVQRRGPLHTEIANLLTKDKKSIIRVPCPECQFTFLSHEELNSHLTSEGRCQDPTTICDICAEICPKGFFSLHMSQHYCLEGCDLTFNTLADRKVHMQEFHKKVTLTTKGTRTKVSQSRLKRPGKIGLRARFPLETLRSWGRDYPFKCDYEGCQCSYKHDWTLNHHKRSYHLRERPFPCDICGKRFFLPSLLTKHKRAIHPGEKDKVFPCDWPGCGEFFAYQFLLKVHKDKYHLKIRKSFKCDICKKTFTTKTYLRKHTAVIHTGQKNYHCPICNQSFLRRIKSYPYHHQCQHKELPGPPQIQPLPKERTSLLAVSSAATLNVASTSTAGNVSNIP